MGEMHGTLDAKELASLSRPSDIVIPDMMVSARSARLLTAFDRDDRVGGHGISRGANDH